jgi:NADH:ubiquinone oxidoreductase subunit 3 (subunit A)
MKGFFLSPPVVFILFLIIGALILKLSARFSQVGKESERKLESYACGQRDVQNNLSPDYSQFFPYAFFFTIMHVLVLLVATAPKNTLLLPLVCIGAGILSLIIIFRSDSDE